MIDEQQMIRLLLVDDEFEFLSRTAALLRRREINVTAVQNGFEALERMEREPFDVAVVDLKMPGMMGDTLFNKMKQRWPEIPVIILTGYGDFRHVGQLSKAGIYYFLRKPCDIENLVSVARQAVDKEWRKWIHRLNLE